MERLIIVGAGRFARVLLQWIRDINKKNPTYEIVGFLTVKDECVPELRLKIIGKAEQYIPHSTDCFACGVCVPEDKKYAVKPLCEKNARFVSVIHPTANIANRCNIGQGVVVFPFATISANTIVEDFVTVLFSGMGHDAIARKYVTINSGCDITGGVVLEEGAEIRSNAVIVPHKKVESGAIVESGSVVIRTVQAGTTVFGNPARRKKS